MLGGKAAGSEPWSQATLWDLMATRVRGHPCPGSAGLCPLGQGARRQPALPPSPAVYIIVGRVFLLSAVILSFLTTVVMVSFASRLFPRTRKHNLVSGFISFLTGGEQQGAPAVWVGDLGRRPEMEGGVVSGEGIFRAPLLRCPLSEVAHPSPPPQGL